MKITAMIFFKIIAENKVPNMFIFVGETDPSKFLDMKNRGGNGGQTGDLQWDLSDIVHNFTTGKVMTFCQNLSHLYHKLVERTEIKLLTC